MCMHLHTETYFVVKKGVIWQSQLSHYWNRSSGPCMHSNMKIMEAESARELGQQKVSDLVVEGQYEMDNWRATSIELQQRAGIFLLCFFCILLKTRQFLAFNITNRTKVYIQQFRQLILQNFENSAKFLPATTSLPLLGNQGAYSLTPHPTFQTTANACQCSWSTHSLPSWRGSRISLQKKLRGTFWLEMGTRALGLKPQAQSKDTVSTLIVLGFTWVVGWLGASNGCPPSLPNFATQ